MSLNLKKMLEELSFSRTLRRKRILMVLIYFIKNHSIKIVSQKLKRIINVSSKIQVLGR